MKLKKCRWCSCSEFVKVAVTDYPASLKYEAEYRCSRCTKHKLWVHRPKGDGPKPDCVRRAAPGKGAQP